MNKCEHIAGCDVCSKVICSYCIEDCSGCQQSFCKECYEDHQIPCYECLIMLCHTEGIIISMVDGEKITTCPICNMKNGKIQTHN